MQMIHHTSSPVKLCAHNGKLEEPFTPQTPESLTAVIYCEGCFGEIDGKTANGLIRSSEKYKILSVIDSTKAGQDAGIVLDNEPNNIPIVRDLNASLLQASETPNAFIFGMAPSSGLLSKHQRGLMLEAMSHGMNIVNGLHEFLNDDPVFIAACQANNVTIDDVRRPKDKKHLRQFSGKIADVDCPRIAILGTDCAIGKRTTATVLTNALNNQGIKAILISTGQTGLIQGARYGIAIDAIPSQFCAGELEATIIEAYENENPDVIIIEGQGALSHPAFSSSAFILRGSCPNGVILQHAPARLQRCDFEHMAMPDVASEIHLIETFSDTKVIGVTINHEGMSSQAVDDTIEQYEQSFGVPTTDALLRSSDDLISMVLQAYPHLKQPLAVGQ
jgi:uncharacterized NAD-dependent epimerase/dehydratase family protein